jgi:hypothetical protein
MAAKTSTAGPCFSYDERNGFTIAWTARGEIAPPATASK